MTSRHLGIAPSYLVQNTTNAIGALTYQAYDAEFNRVMTIDPLNNPSYWNYDLRSLVTNTRDALGNYVYFQYDGTRQLTTRLEPPQNGSTVLALTYYDYDLAGRRQNTKDAYLNVSYMTYDLAGNMIMSLNPRQATNGFVFSYFNYDPDNRQVEIRDLGQLRTYFYFDAVGNRVQVDQEQGYGRQPWGTSPHGGERVSTYFTFDNLNRLSTAISPQSLYSQTVSLTYTGYDAASRRVQTRVENPKGGSDVRYSYWRYDALNRVTSVLDPNPATSGGAAGVTTFGYDATGNRTLAADQEGRPTYVTFDAINRQQNRRDAFLNTTYSAYDGANNVIREVDAVGRTIYFDHDSLNRVIRRSNALGQVNYFGFDARSEMVLSQNARFFCRYFAYDLLGRLQTQKDALNGVRYFGFDEVGNKVLEVDESGNPSYWAYDQGNRVRAFRDALQNQLYFGWDAPGLVRQKLDQDGRLTFLGYFGYDATRRVTTLMFDADPWIYYTYDSLGNLIQFVDRSGTNADAYDFLNRLTMKLTAGGVVYYAYDRAGFKSDVKDTDLTESYFGYDAASRLVQIQLLDGTQRATYYSYDASGLMTRKALPNNSVLCYYYYDNAGRLSQLENKPGSAPATYITYFAYARDPNGAIVSLTRESGRYAYYTFDALERLTREQQFNVSNVELYGFQYNYDAASNRYFKYDEVAGKATYFSFDARNYLTKEVQQ